MSPIGGAWLPPSAGLTYASSGNRRTMGGTVSLIVKQRLYMLTAAMLVGAGLAGCGEFSATPVSTVTVTAAPSTAPAEPDEPVGTSARPSPSMESPADDQQEQNLPVVIITANAEELCTTPVRSLPDMISETDSPEHAEILQIVALDMGYDVSLSGVYDKQTIRAVVEMQSDLGVVPDGQVGPITWSALQSEYCPEFGQTFGQSSPTTGSQPSNRDFKRQLCRSDPSDLPALTPGESSEGVKLLQWAMRELGLYRGAIGGNYGQQTLAATSQFQLDVGLGGSGNVAINTWSALQSLLCPGLSGPVLDTDCSGYDVVELQDGPVSGLLASYGIWTNDPSTGRFLGMGGVIDQMWAKWFGSSTARVSREELNLELQGGFLGADLRRFFGDYPYIYDRVVQGLYVKVDNGSARCM